MLFIKPHVYGTRSYAIEKLYLPVEIRLAILPMYNSSILRVQITREHGDLLRLHLSDFVVKDWRHCIVEVVGVAPEEVPSGDLRRDRRLIAKEHIMDRNVLLVAIE